MREIPVASEKIAVDQASRRPERSSTRASIGRASHAAVSAHSRHRHVSTSPIRSQWGGGRVRLKRAPGGDAVAPLVPSAPPANAGFHTNAEHQATEEARPI